MRPTILLLDDDLAFRRSVTHSLETRGARVVPANKGRAATGLLGVERPDLVVVDGLLPDVNGVQWIEGLRAAGDGRNVVFVSAFFRDMRTYRHLKEDLGVLDVLHKPIVPELFAEQVMALVERRPAPEPRAPFPLATDYVAPAELDGVFFVPEQDDDEDLEPTAPHRLPPAALDAAPAARPRRPSYDDILPPLLESLITAVARVRERPDHGPFVDEALEQARGLHASAPNDGFPEVGAIAGRLEAALQPLAEAELPRWEDVEGAVEGLAAQLATLRDGRSAVPLDTLPVRLVSQLLVVDDDPALVDFLRSALAEEVVGLLPATDRAQTLRLVREQRPDAALVGMPFGDPDQSAALIEALRKAAPRLPVGIVSLEDGGAARLDAARAGADVFLAHPFDVDDLVHVLGRLNALVDKEPLRVALLSATDTLPLVDRLVEAGAELSVHATLDDLFDAPHPEVFVLGRLEDDVAVCAALRASAAGEDAAIVEVSSSHADDVRRAGADDVLVGRLPEDRARTILDWARRVRRSRRHNLFDPRTELPSRAAIASILHGRIAMARRRGRPMTIAVFDIDGLSELNRTHGRGAGDRVLGAVARLLRGRFRMEDLRGRWGKDELIIAFEDASPATVAPLVQHFLKEVASLEIRSVKKSGRFHFTVTGALAGYPEAGKRLGDLVEMAGRRLAVARRTGTLVFR